MGDGLSLDQRTLAREIAIRHHMDSELVDALDRGELAPGQKKILGDRVTEDLARTGFDSEYRLTGRGRRLEDLLDALVVNE